MLDLAGQRLRSSFHHGTRRLRQCDRWRAESTPLQNIKSDWCEIAVYGFEAARECQTTIREMSRLHGAP
jgi:hypothetical protein